MNCEYIETGRYEQPTIWVNDLKPLAQFPSSDATTIALTRTQAIELRQELSKAIKQAVKAREN